MEMYNYQIIAEDVFNVVTGYNDTTFTLDGCDAMFIYQHLKPIAEKHGVSLEGIFSELHLIAVLNSYDNINVELLQLNSEGSLEPMDF